MQRVTLQQVWRWYCSWTGVRGGSSSSLPAGGAAALGGPSEGGRGEQGLMWEESGSRSSP